MKLRYYLIIIFTFTLRLLFPHSILGASLSEPIIADHKAVAKFDQIPEYWIEQVKQQFKIGYGHTSHGSQITRGMILVKEIFGDLYNYYTPSVSYPNPPSSCLAGSLCYYEGSSYTQPGWLSLDCGYWPTWRDETAEFLSNQVNLSQFNTIMWSWCGQASSKTEITMNNEYLLPMANFEQQYPDIIFIYMTGHLDGTGVNGNLNQRNEQIRNFVRENNKVLFDFADIESYNPDGSYFLDKAANDNCDYDSNSDGTRDSNWAVEWCDANPSSSLCLNEYPYCNPGMCAHSHCLNCNMKGRAFWWLMARLAGWPGVEVNPSPSPFSNPACQLDISGNNIVDADDVKLVLQNYGFPNPTEYDFNLDNIINNIDLGWIIKWWGSSCQ